VPKAASVALLVNPTNPIVDTQSRNLQATAVKPGLRTHVANASSERDFDATFAKLSELRADAVTIRQDPLFNAQSGPLRKQTTRGLEPRL
jgi:hypothetical protein